MNRCCRSGAVVVQAHAGVVINESSEGLLAPPGWDRKFSGVKCRALPGYDSKFGPALGGEVAARNTDDPNLIRVYIDTGRAWVDLTTAERRGQEDHLRLLRIDVRERLQ